MRLEGERERDRETNKVVELAAILTTRKVFITIKYSWWD
jgi:hypothetical protein